jgi:hypothetical protein
MTEEPTLIRGGNLTTRVDLDLSADQLWALGAMVRGQHGPLSPWADSNRGVDSLPENVGAGLGKLAGFESAEMVAALQPALAAIAGASGRTTVRVRGGGAHVECVAFASKNYGPVALSDTTGDDTLHLEDPAPTNELIELITGLVGTSPLRGLDLTLDLSVNDAFVLAALVDAQRRNTLSDLAGGHTVTNRPVGFTALEAALNAPTGGGFWLVGAVARSCDTEPSQVGPGVRDSIARLADQRLVDATPSTATLAGVGADLAEHFLAITSTVELDNARDDGSGGVKRFGFTCLQAGVTDLITVEWTSQGIHLETVSAATLVGYIKTFLRHPEFGDHGGNG